MANKQDIITAIKNLDLFLKIPELKGAKPRLNSNGIPFAFVGGFNMVFQLIHNAKKWAFRVWHVPMGENKNRYVAISKYLTNSNLPYFADFIYDENSLLINGELTDTIRMEWLDGVLLKDYIEKHLNDKAKLESLANDFLEMTKTLREAKISHGDLQEGNILVDDSGKIRLVDYDSICIPEIEGQKELVTGLKGYQHPSRFKNSKASLKADYFSELIIYISILGIAEKPDLWNKYQIKDTQYLLFTEVDFENFESCEINKDLKGLSPLIDRLLFVLEQYLSNNDFRELNSFSTYLLPPKIISFKSDKEVVMIGGEIELFWEIENALKIKITPEIGEVPFEGKRVFKPDTKKYTIIAEGYSESASKTIEIKLFPTPIIESLFVSAPIIREVTNLQIQIPKFPEIDISINNIQNGIQLSEQKFRSNIPVFNHNSFEQIKLIKNETNTTLNNVIPKLFSRILNINKWLLRKEKNKIK